MLGSITNTCQEWEYNFDPQKEPLIDLILAAEDLTEEVAEAVLGVWDTPQVCPRLASLPNSLQVVQALKRANEIQIPGGGSGAQYYIKNSKRIAGKGYRPTYEDIVRAKMRTTGISEVCYLHTRIY